VTRDQVIGHLGELHAQGLRSDAILVAMTMLRADGIAGDVLRAQLREARAENDDLQHAGGKLVAEWAEKASFQRTIAEKLDRRLHDANNLSAGLACGLDAIGEIARQVREPFSGVTAMDLLDAIDTTVAAARAARRGEGATP
jgi:hypothetical protein